MPKDDSSKNLHFIPFFVMKADNNNKLEVNVEQRVGKNTSIISITMLVSPQKMLEEIAAYIRRQEEINPNDNRFKNIQASNLSGINLFDVEVAESSIDRIGFRSEKYKNYFPQGEIKLEAEVPANNAKEIAQDLRDGKLLPTFLVKYSLDARNTYSQSQLQIDMRYFYETKAAKDLLGAAKTSEKFGWKVDTNNLQLNQPYLTRDQRSIFEGRMKTEVKMLIQLEDENDIEYLKTMQNYFGKILETNTLDTDKTPLGRELTNMTAYEFDPKDLRPDEIDQLVSDAKTFFSSEEKEFVNTNIAGKASFLGFGGEAGKNETRESLKKRMEDKGWKFEPKGKFTVPKSFEVHIVNTKAIKTEGVYNLTIAKTKQQSMELNNQVSTKSLYYPKMTNKELETLVEIQEKLKKLTGKILKYKEIHYQIILPDQESLFGTPWIVKDNDTTHSLDVGPFGEQVLSVFWTTDSPRDLEAFTYVFPFVDNKQKNLVKLNAHRVKGRINTLRVRVHILYIGEGTCE